MCVLSKEQENEYLLSKTSLQRVEKLHEIILGAVRQITHKNTGFKGTNQWAKWEEKYPNWTIRQQSVPCQLVPFSKPHREKSCLAKEQFLQRT